MFDYTGGLVHQSCTRGLSLRLIRVASHNVGTGAGALAVNDELIFVAVADEILILARS